MSEADDDYVKSLGLGYAVIQETEGKLAAEKMREALASMVNEGRAHNKATRMALAEGLGAWQGVVGAEVKDGVYKEHGEAIFQCLAKMLGSASDEDGPEVGAAFIGGISWQFSTDTALAKRLAPAVIGCLKACADGDMGDTKPMKEDGPAVFRANGVASVLSCLPYDGPDKAQRLPEDTVELIASLISREPHVTSLQAQAYSSLTTLATYSSNLFVGNMDAVFKAVRAYPNTTAVLSSLQNFYSKDPEPYKANIDLLLSMEMSSVCSILQQISSSEPMVLAPYIDKIYETVSDPLYGSMAMIWLKDIATKDESHTVVKIEDLDARFDSAFAAPGVDTTFAMAVGAAGRGTASHADRAVELLARLLSDSRLSNWAPAVVINELNNLKESISDRETILGPHMEAIRKHEGSNAALVQAIEDFYAGRSLEVLSERVDAVEKRIIELNDAVSSTCANFEDVKQYMDEHVEELKEFVGGVVKKLPTPSRLTVKDGLSKKLLLHFPCCRQHSSCTSCYGAEFVVETREWNKWLKIGFSVAKLSKCVIDVGVGNPLGIVKSGISAISEIYTHYRAEDDKEFNTYITQPFLTSEEQDKLLGKLKGSDFFSLFEYDAQLGGWHCSKCKGSPGQSAAMLEIEALGLDKHGKVEVQKGKMMNLDKTEAVALAKKVVGHAKVRSLAWQPMALGLSANASSNAKAAEAQ
ncbi:unnamed protein product [Chrysoparadoxa australica]